ncbi:MAG: hypothetical protein GEU83_14670 [Pseudonocardiaceae bacterium]|nr:hypothetical protein [Pseudonocardiaceae bacterium]
MRSKLVAAATLAVCMMGLGAPTAVGQDERSTEPTTTEPQPSDIEVTLALNPATVAPGQTVIATAACGAGDEATLASPVLAPVVLTADPDGHQPWALHGTTTVRQDAQPGDHDVVADCDGGAVSTVLTVLPVCTDSDDDGDQVERVPKGAPETGGGPEPDLLAPVVVAAGLAGLAGIAGLAARRAARR